MELPVADHALASPPACNARPSSAELRAALDSLAQVTQCCAAHATPGQLTPAKTAPRRADRDGRIPGSRHFVLRDVTVVEPDRARQAHVDVTVVDGRISAIHPTGAAAPAPGAATIITAHAGCTVLPGLIDMHAHLPPHNLLDLGGQFALLYLAHGVTTIREAGDVDGTAVGAVRRGMARGRFDGPRLLSAGWFVTAGRPRWPNSLVLRSPDDAPAIVARLVADGCHSMKLYENLSVGMIRALVEAAQVAGIKTLGHVPSQLGFETARLPDAQHLFGVPPPASLRRDHVVSRAADWADVTDARMQVIVDAAITHGLANTPTLISSHQLLEYARYDDAIQDPRYRLLPRLYRAVVWSPQRGLASYRGLTADDFARLRDASDKKRALVRKLFDAGARLHLGTDVQQPFVVPGASLLDEMRQFAAAGIAPAAIWRLATRGAADYLGLDDLGAVRPGALADLGVYRRDPTVDLAALDSLEAVVSQGQLFAKPAIDARLAREQAAHDGMFFDHIAPLLARLALWRTSRNFVG